MNRKITIIDNKFLPIFWNGEETEINYDITLAKPGVELSLLGLLLGDSNKELQININVIHSVPNTKSKIILKGVLKDTSKINFQGLVKIKKGAKGTNTWLATHLLILSDQAKGIATPSLEILENDIKAGHAATVGKVSDMEMFYLQSRGLSTQKAKDLIVQGFLSSILQKMPESIQRKVHREHLEGGL